MNSASTFLGFDRVKRYHVRDAEIDGGTFHFKLTRDNKAPWAAQAMDREGNKVEPFVFTIECLIPPHNTSFREMWERINRGNIGIVAELIERPSPENTADYYLREVRVHGDISGFLGSCIRNNFVTSLMFEFANLLNELSSDLPGAERSFSGNTLIEARRRWATASLVAG